MKHLPFVASLLGAILLSATTLVAQENAPLPLKLMEAKTIFLLNQTGNNAVLDGAYQALKKWGRWKVLTDKDAADLILQIDGTAGTKQIPYTLPKYETITQPGQWPKTKITSEEHSLPWPDNNFLLHVLDSDSGEPLWTTHASALSLENCGKDLIENLQKRIAKQPAVPTVTPKPANESPSAPTVQQQVEPSTITFKSSPEGADITVDGKFVGSTPSTVQLTPGDHEVTIQKRESVVSRIADGEETAPIYKIWKRTLTVNPGGVITVDATLEMGQ